MANRIDVNSSASRSPSPRTARVAGLQPEGGLNANTPNAGHIPLTPSNPAIGGIAPAVSLANLQNAAE